MRAIRVAPLALSGATALLLASPAAHAVQDGGSPPPFIPTVTPSVITPGGQVTLGSGGCSGGTTVTSGVFDTVVIPSGTTTAVATVDKDAQQGAIYAVTFKCGSSGDAKNTGLTITGTGTGTGTSSTGTDTNSTGTSSTSSTGTSSAAGTATAPASLAPVIGTATAVATASSTSLTAPAGVQGGLGGSIGSLDGEEIALGAALVLVAATGTVYFVRRRGAAGRH